jgi:hypothetical protein
VKSAKIHEDYTRISSRDKKDKPYELIIELLIQSINRDELTPCQIPCWFDPHIYV